jgi:hypothetical protein
MMSCGAAADALEFAGGAAHQQATVVLESARGSISSVRASAFDADRHHRSHGNSAGGGEGDHGESGAAGVQAAIDTDPDMDVRENAVETLTRAGARQRSRLRC